MRVSLLAVLVVGACGGGGGGSGGDGGPGGGSDASFVPDTAPTYHEMAEATNGMGMPEATGQTVTATGFAIEGNFEASSPTLDAYVFNTGAFGGATQPDFPGIDVIVFVAGQRMSTGQTEAFMNLDAVANDGFSPLTLGGFINAAVTRGKDYKLALTPAAKLAGKPYRIEIRGHMP